MNEVDGEIVYSCGDFFDFGAFQLDALPRSKLRGIRPSD